VIARFVWLLLTFVLYLASRRAQRLARGSPLLNPVLLSAAVVVVVLVVARRDVTEYREAAAPLLWLLGPATVALAVPLYRSVREIRSALAPALAALVVGSSATVTSAVAVGLALGATLDTDRALAAKSVTTPIAMAITEQLGGVPALAAVFVMITGSLGAVFGTLVFDRVGIRDARARGLAMGVVAHGMGTARSFQLSPIMGTFSGIAMTVNGVLTALVLPFVWMGCVAWFKYK
jgi:predicted murein hydrolase (TIGR00659 family)